jgi:hypothetical protein
MAQEKYEVPEICYDEPLPGQPANQFPFILLKAGKKMPPVLFIEERRETGEVEPGPNGESIEIVDSLMHKFVDMEVLKEKLPPHLNNMVRTALGMKPLEEATVSGQAILDKVMAAVEKNKTKKGPKQ